jgi:hypothetical protein
MSIPTSIVIKRLPNGTLETNVPTQITLHSSGGYEIGYNGSGPADLALNTLLLITDEETAMRHYQCFKREFIATMPFDGGSIPLKDIQYWLNHQLHYKGE